MNETISKLIVSWKPSIRKEQDKSSGERKIFVALSNHLNIMLMDFEKSGSHAKKTPF